MLNSHLLELFDIDHETGVIRLGDERMVIQSTAALGLLRKELINTVGLETGRRVRIRFGFAQGCHDALSLKERLANLSPEERILMGCTLHTLEGLVTVEPLKISSEPGRKHFEMEALWHNSHEGAEHLKHFDRGAMSVCWATLGYATGFATACAGHDIYFQEVECVAKGDARCRVIGKDAGSWGEALEGIRADYLLTDQGRPRLTLSGLQEEVQSLQAATRSQQEKLLRYERILTGREPEMDLLRARVANMPDSARFIVRSAAMEEVLRMAAQVAPLDTHVVIVGESGTGKEFIAQFIHEHSGRAAEPMVVVNCAALPETLLESELFGHKKGAFTGAVKDKVGLFEHAGNGTLFLDEIGEMPLSTQAKLLRVLENREARRVGDEHTFKVRARIVAATNRDLREAVAQGSFRSDLYFRIGAFPILTPPLRARQEDIPPLVYEFMQRSSARVQKEIRSISSEAMALLIRYPWPGNVRELQHVIERAVIVARGDAVAARDLPPEVLNRPRIKCNGGSLDLKEREITIIQEALERFSGNRTKAAEALHISPVTLWRKLKRHHLMKDPLAT
ncbi:MAG: sigma-54-dependent Fis family transcriptional regulator [Acidobacteria bacterium]|nr:sigma-54-dependent Fis family transcriptional regulator [Acidobacteriota bacterium]MBI3489395.1 sigma-54-dependent Fis family transcriptional regulator [Acidobacteriota bacterium]